MKILFFARLALVAASFAASAYLYPRLPAELPVHWNAAGVADNFAGKAFGAFLMPGVLLAMAALFAVLPRLDPKRDNYPKFERAWELIQTAMVALFAALHGLMLANALGAALPMEVWVPVGVGVLFAFMGNFMGKIRKNYMIGFRFSWTLESEDVWNRTHRFGGRLWTAGGIVLAASALSRFYPEIVLWFAIVLPVAAIFAYSYRISRK